MKKQKTNWKDPESVKKYHRTYKLINGLLKTGITHETRRKKNGKKLKDMTNKELKAYYKRKRKEASQDPIRREIKNKNQREYYKNNKAKCNQYVYNWIKKQNKLKNK